VTQFKDHFSKQAAEYSRYRPDYPPELFDYLARLAGRNGVALDCATGNGQAAVALARHFDTVIAIDASSDQIANAVRHERVTYLVAPAEKIPVADHCADLLTIAQALHWLHFEEFFSEVRRVVVPGGVFAAWLYVGSSISPELDVVIRRYEHEVVGAYWPPERKLVDEHYRTIPMPFPELPAPSFSLVKEWTLEEYVGYLFTWSATQKYMQHNADHSFPRIREELSRAWGDPQTRKVVRWPLYFRIGKVA
jgi:SAM-dependent methyltransferase